MKRWALLGLVALATLGCRTHHVSDCRPACGSANRESFAHCVASGTTAPAGMPGGCQAGNRRCCALAENCVGDLDDQTVVSDADPATCPMNVDPGMCEHPCGVAEDQAYATCVADGSSMGCAPDDLECCGLEQDCLGSLGDAANDTDIVITHDGCCVDQTDCPSGLVCDPMFFTCMGGSATCGDGTMDSGEDCDDHNTVTESCAYGLMSCTVCDASCHHAAGATHFCGDGTIDLSDGESCEPPNEPLICDATCMSLQPATCTNGVRDGTETDIDCGGRECAACLSGELCGSPTDCRPEHATDCPGSMTDCNTGSGLCQELHMCSDTDPCTDDACSATGGCTHTMLDRDGDGHAPGGGVGCGDDCNDRNDTVFGGAPELCDGLDNDCNEMIDDGCT